ncbi:hypothetical protein HG530_008790 [Fusarium avenaceum]|nr:hypothetical protein HG530_008790 [Fusarium avenaceum]
MFRPDKEGKHGLSPQSDDPNSKRGKATYLVESPGGTLRESDLFAIHQHSLAAMNDSSSKPSEAKVPQLNDPGPEVYGTGARVHSLSTLKPPIPAFGPPLAALGPSNTAFGPPITARGPPISAFRPPIATRGPFSGAPDPSFAGSSRRPAFPGPQNSQSGNQQQASEGQYPPELARRTNINQDLSQEHLSTLSVAEKVRKGIAMGLANTLPYENAPPGTKLPMNCMTVGNMMKRMDTAYHMSPALSSFHSEGDLNGADMVNEELPFDGYAPLARLAAHQNRMQHMQSRIPHLAVTSARLQVVTETGNMHRWSPIELSECSPELVMRIEPLYDHASIQASIQANGTLGPPSLTSWLGWARRRFGYRKLELESLIFVHDKEKDMSIKQSLSVAPKKLQPSTNKDTFEGSSTNEDTSGGSSTNDEIDVLELDDLKGSITVYELTVLAHGTTQQAHSWTWFEIVKPLLDLEGPTPEGLSTIPNAVLTFVMPTASIEKVTEDKPVKLEDLVRLKVDAYNENAGRQLKLGWRFTRNGIPTFVTTPKPQLMQEQGFPPDFFYVEAAPRYSDDRQWWRTVRDQAINDRGQWQHVQALMSSNVCLADMCSKKGAKWVKVKSEAQRSIFGRNLMPDSGSGSRRAKTTHGASGLRNQVQ